MAIIVPNEGEPILLNLVLKAALLVDEPFILHLFRNDYTVTGESEFDDFVEASFAGYVPVQLDRDQWSYPVTDGGLAYSLYGVEPITFYASSGSQNIYGYYVTDEDETKVVWAENYPGVVLVSATNPAVVFPYMRLRSLVE